MRRALKWVGIVFAVLIVVAVAAIVGAVGIGAMLFERQAQIQVPAGYARNSSLYVTAADGTRIAVDIWLPDNLAAGQHVPALIKGTPYWRGRELSLIGEAFATFVAPALAVEPDTDILNARGYAVVTVDARGTGASFGTVKTMFADAEVADYGSVADWITQQPWSNGKVGAYGFSYRGITAANIASLPNPSIKAVAPLFDLPDLYLVMRPGGAVASYLLNAWGTQTRVLNDGQMPCQGDVVCELLIRGPKPVDADGDHALLKQAIAQHSENYNVRDCALAAPARDDMLCASGQSLSDVSLIARKAKVEARALPMFVLTGWLDESSPAQVLYRFKTFSNRQELVIGPFTHGGFQGDDPFAPARPLDMSFKKQTLLMADFFDRYLGEGAPRPIDSSVHYYVLGAGTWRTSPAWPPVGTVAHNWYLAGGYALSETAPAKSDGQDLYKVDFATTSGTLSRYRGQVDLSQTNYGDRAKADARLLAYTGAPFEHDTEITGSPVAHLRLASSASDALVIVYLEDVAPDGRVTYVSEGTLRLAHRKLAAPSATVLSADPLHSYLKADMAPMQPGAFEDVTIAISPIAALARKGHRLRIAIAGADEGNLERIPAQGEESLTIERGPATYIEVPTAP